MNITFVLTQQSWWNKSRAMSDQGGCITEVTLSEVFVRGSRGSQLGGNKKFFQQVVAKKKKKNSYFDAANRWWCVEIESQTWEVPGPISQVLRCWRWREVEVLCDDAFRDLTPPHLMAICTLLRPRAQLFNQAAAFQNKKTVSSL